MPIVSENRGLLIALAEWWHSETYSFHILMGEATITLEDTYEILCILIKGE